VKHDEWSNGFCFIVINFNSSNSNNNNIINNNSSDNNKSNSKRLISSIVAVLKGKYDLRSKLTADSSVRDLFVLTLRSLADCFDRLYNNSNSNNSSNNNNNSKRLTTFDSKCKQTHTKQNSNMNES
jgi:hypothetical protein